MGTRLELIKTKLKPIRKKVEPISKYLRTNKKATIAIVLVMGLLLSYFTFFVEEISATTEIKEATPVTDTIVKSLDGSGTVQPYEQYDIIALVGGDILEDYVDVGTVVSEGALLYHIDSSEVESNIEKAENSLQKQQNSYNDSLSTIEDMNIKSDIKGTVTEIHVTVGQQISSGTKILDVIDTSNIKISLPFHKASVGNIKVNDTASVVVEQTGETLVGTVINIASGEYISSNGTLVCDVEISLKNPGVITEGYTGSATVNGISPAGTSNFEYKSKSSIISNASGKIEKINVIKGDTVYSSTSLVTLSNDSTESTVENSALSLDDSRLSFEQTLNQLDDYKLTSPIDGTIIQKDYKTGDTIEAGKTSLGIVADMSKVKFTMEIDELNIKQIEVGAEVLINADAIAGGTFLGEITNIGIIGVEDSGVTTYPVEVVIEKYEGLLPGMNVNATIVTEKVEDALIIPNSYVNRGNMVLVSSEYAKTLEKSEAKQPIAGTLASMPSSIDGYEYMYIEVGISDGTNIEVLKGLSEDVKIYVQIITSTSEDSDEVMPMAGGMVPSEGMIRPAGGAGGGGAPGGGRQ